MEYIKLVFNAINESVFIENIEFTSNESYKVRKYSEHTKTNWIVYKTHPNYKKFEYRKEYVCQHSVKNKTTHAESNATRVRNKNCTANIDILIRKETKKTLRDTYMKKGLNFNVHVSTCACYL
ncbi:hypothetical protein QTP88_008469 [Uroleucon formosanum]